METQGGERIASEDGIPSEKWLVAYRNPASKKYPDGSVFMRQFLAPGYYEAYDTVITFAEKMSLEVLWFREKRSCEPYLNRNFPELETVCIYCKRAFNHVEPVPCIRDGCGALFCSKECMSEHTKMRH